MKKYWMALILSPCLLFSDSFDGEDFFLEGEICAVERTESSIENYQGSIVLETIPNYCPHCGEALKDQKKGGKIARLQEQAAMQTPVQAPVNQEELDTVAQVNPKLMLSKAAARRQTARQVDPSERPRVTYRSQAETTASVDLAELDSVETEFESTKAEKPAPAVKPAIRDNHEPAPQATQKEKEPKAQAPKRSIRAQHPQVVEAPRSKKTQAAQVAESKPSHRSRSGTTKQFQNKRPAAYKKTEKTAVQETSEGAANQRKSKNTAATGPFSQRMKDPMAQPSS